MMYVKESITIHSLTAYQPSPPHSCSGQFVHTQDIRNVSLTSFANIPSRQSVRNYPLLSYEQKRKYGMNDMQEKKTRRLLRYT